MADAKARAAARRQAILAGKSDRLAKLTTKAKNEGDVAASVRDPTDDPPLAELPAARLGTPPRSTGTRLNAEDALQWSHRTANRSSSLTPEPSNWDAQQRENFMRALMAGPPQEGLGQPFGMIPGFGDGPSNPFAVPDASSAMAPRPKTFLEKILPLLHVVTTVLFLWFFVVLNKTPSSSFIETEGEGGRSTEYWSRWADLWTNAPSYEWPQDYTHVLWSFLSLQIGLHSFRIFTRSSPPSIPMLLELALPHLPPSISNTITTGFRYMQMAGLLLDDFSVLLVGVAAVIFYSTWSQDI